MSETTKHEYTVMLRISNSLISNKDQRIAELEAQLADLQARYDADKERGHKYRSRLEAQLAEARAALSRPWKPIETGPKDRKLFLGWAPCLEGPPNYCLCQYSPSSGFFTYDPFENLQTPTHWMPLPPPPTEEPEESQ
jgi:hypothetical protein